MNNYSVTSENFEIRARARKLLEGNWGMAVVVILVTGLITGLGGSSSGSTSGDGGWFTGIVVGLIAIASVFAIAYTILVANVVDYGSTVTFLKFSRDNNISFEVLFSGFKDYGRIVGVMFLRNLFIFLWSLLLIIPGIIKGYSYAMTEYLIADNPGMEPLEAITKSREMMNGWKAKLFLLDLSLIGWWFLCLFTCGIGFLWLGAYFKTNRALFYNEMINYMEDGPDDGPSEEEILVEAAQEEIAKLNQDSSF